MSSFNISKEGTNHSTVELPEGLSAFEGLPRSLDSRGIAYMTYVLGRADYESEDAARADADDVIAYVEKVLLNILYAKQPTAVEWRLQPNFEIAEYRVGKRKKRLWRGQVRWRWSLHGTEDDLQVVA